MNVEVGQTNSWLLTKCTAKKIGIIDPIRWEWYIINEHDIKMEGTLRVKEPHLRANGEKDIMTEGLMSPLLSMSIIY